MGKQIAEFIINGEPHEVILEPHLTLIEVIRDKLGLTGTKHSCSTGLCGACTVIIDGNAVNSCLILAVTVKNKNILTVEGLADDNALHPLQEAFIHHGAVQCGFCTPGMLMSAKSLLDKKPSPTEDDVRIALSGNLCRCTGYVKIVDAVLDVADKMRQGD